MCATYPKIVVFYISQIDRLIVAALRLILPTRCLCSFVLQCICYLIAVCQILFILNAIYIQRTENIIFILLCFKSQLCCCLLATIAKSIRKVTAIANSNRVIAHQLHLQIGDATLYGITVRDVRHINLCIIQRQGIRFFVKANASHTTLFREVIAQHVSCI